MFPIVNGLKKKEHSPHKCKKKFCPIKPSPA